MEKKSNILIAVIISLSLCAFVFAACDGAQAFTPYTITLYVDGEIYDTVNVGSADFDLNAVLSSVPTKDGSSRVFSHWEYEDGRIATADDLPATDVALYAVFKDADVFHTVMFKDKDGNYLALDGKYSQFVQAGGSATAPEAPVFEGYTFKGWDRDFRNVTEDLVVTALYVLNSHKVTFTSFGETVSETDVFYGEDISLCEPEVDVPDGLTFLGWTSADGKEYGSMPDKDLTLEAKWKLDVADGVSLSLSADSVTYGQSAVFDLSFYRNADTQYETEWRVDGVKAAEGEATTFELKRGAGKYRVYAVVTAKYKGLESSVYSETKIVEVQKAPLTVSAVESTVIYGEPYSPLLTYEGFVNGEDASVLTSPVNVVTDYEVGAATGAYGVTLGGASADNYEITYSSSSVSVAKRQLTLTVNDENVTYGDAFEPSGYTLSGVAACDETADLGVPELYCAYPTASKDAGSYDVVVEKGLDGDKAGNYAVTYENGTLTVNKKTVYVTLDAVDDIVYLDPVPEFTWSVQGTVYGEGAGALGDIEVVCNYSQGAPIGEYEVYAAATGEAKNYIAEVTTDVADPVVFCVARYAVKFEGNVLRDNRYQDVLWSADAADFVKGLPAGYTVGGVLSVTTNVTGTYTLHGQDITQNFEWSQPFVVYDGNGADCTENFALTYDFSLTLGAMVDIEANNHAYDYDGTAKGAGVTIADDSYTVEYVGADGGYSSDYPTFTDAGEYVVAFRVLDAEGETVAESSYRITINKIYNVIEFDENASYVYDGTLQTVTGASAQFENAQISYVGNTFTDVPDGGVLAFTAIAAETANYKETMAQFSVTVSKADHTQDEIPAVDCRVYAEPGKTLASVTAPENFVWTSPEAVQIYVGEQYVDAMYCADSRNYNACATTVLVTGEKTPLAIVSSDVVSVAFGTQFVPQYSFEKNSLPFDPSGVGELLTVSADVNSFAVGSTYRVTLSLDDNAWYTAPDTIVTVKVPSVLYGGAYYTIEDALRLVQAAESFIIVAYDTSFALPEVAAGVYTDASYYTLSAGENLLVPYSEAHSTNAFDYATGTVIKNNAYATLYIPSGITFTSSGYVYVAAARNVGSAQPTGNTSGKYGVLNVASGAKFVSDGTFECLGFTKGDGLVEITAGKLYEPMIAIGYKGGNITNTINKTVFPINQYTINNIVADMKVYAGASYYAKAAVGASGEEIPSDVKFLGNSSDVFMNLQSGYIMKSYDDNTGVVTFSVYGNVQFNDMGIELESPFGKVSVSTSGKQVPLPGYFDFNIQNGSTATVNAGVKLLPGASFTVESGATLNVKSNVFVYSGSEYEHLDKSDQYENMSASKIFNGWQDGGNGMTYPHSSAVNFYYTDIVFDFTGETPAGLIVYGNLNVENGAKIAGGITLGEGAKIQVDANAEVSNTIKEDYTDYEDNIKIFNKVISVNAHYFTATASAYYIFGGNEVALEKGRTYVCTADGVTAA